MKAITACFLLGSLAVSGQEVTLTTGGESELYQEKGSEEINFTAGGNNYFFTTNFSSAQTHYYLDCFDASGKSTAGKKLEIPAGVFNNSFSIDEVIGLGSKAFAIVEHTDKSSGKKTVDARVIDPSGSVQESAVELVNYPFTKVNNSGLNYSVVSPDGKTLAVVSILPYVKKMPAKVKVSLFDENLKPINSSEITIPGEDKKNKRMMAIVANDGTVYITKHTTTSKAGISLNIYQYSPSSSKIENEYTIDVTTANRIHSYVHSTNDNNELVVAGTYFEFTRVVVDDQAMNGVFYYTNKGKKDNVFKLSSLDSPIDNLTAQKILFGDNTVFLALEQIKEAKISPPASAAGTPAAFDYNYNYKHGNEYVIGLGVDGTKKFELLMEQEFTARNFHKQYQSAYYMCNGQFTIVYNDLSKKHLEPSESGYSSILPLLVQVSSDGLMKSPVLFKDDLKIPSSYILYPSYSVQKSTSELIMLMKGSKVSKYVSLSIK